MTFFTDLKKVTKETICGALGICVCGNAVFLLMFVEAGRVVLRGKEIKGPLPLGPVSMICGVKE